MTLHCARCGESDDPDTGRVVADRPIGGLGEMHCDRCYAERLAAETVLGELEAQVWARQDSDHSLDGIAEKLDEDREEVRESWRQAQEKRDRARETVAMTDDLAQ